MAPLYRVTWQSKYTGTICHHDAETEESAHAHLSLLRARHPITKYWLEQFDEAPTDRATEAPDELGQGSQSSGIRRRARSVR
jgi:hypothetical protein